MAWRIFGTLRNRTPAEPARKSSGRGSAGAGFGSPISTDPVWWRWGYSSSPLEATTLRYQS